MSIDPSELSGPQGHSHSVEALARPLTIDQSYARAYADVRRLLQSASKHLVGPEERIIFDAAVESIASRLERDLYSLMYGEDLAYKLAHPE